MLPLTSIVRMVCAQIFSVLHLNLYSNKRRFQTSNVKINKEIKRCIFVHWDLICLFSSHRSTAVQLLGTEVSRFPRCPMGTHTTQRTNRNQPPWHQEAEDPHPDWNGSLKEAKRVLSLNTNVDWTEEQKCARGGRGETTGRLSFSLFLFSYLETVMEPLRVHVFASGRLLQEKESLNPLWSWLDRTKKKRKKMICFVQSWSRKTDVMSFFFCWCHRSPSANQATALSLFFLMIALVASEK